MRVEQDLPGLLPGIRGATANASSSWPWRPASLGLSSRSWTIAGRLPSSRRIVLEPAVPVLERVEQAGDLVADGRLADQVAQVTLAGDEADDRGGPLRLGGLDELGDLLDLRADLRRIGDVAGQPEHELVEEQDDGVVAEDVLGVLADDRQALVELDVGVLVGPDRAARSAGTGRRGGRRPADGAPGLPGGSANAWSRDRGVPVGGTPLRRFLAGCRKQGDELLVANLLPELGGVRDEAVVAVDGRERACPGAPWRRGRRSRRGWRRRATASRAGGRARAGTSGPRSHGSCLATTSARPFLPRASGSPLRMACSTAMKWRLAGAERAVEVGGPRRAGLHGGLDEVEGLVEVGGQRVGDDVVGDRGLFPDALGEGEDEVAVVDLVRDRDEVPQQHLVAHTSSPPDLHRRPRSLARAAFKSPS